MKRPIIVLAAHDDGSGAHVTIAWLCRTLIEEGERRENRPLLVSHSACLSRLLDIDLADELIGRCLRDGQNAAMRARMATFRFGEEKSFACYLVDMAGHS